MSVSDPPEITGSQETSAGQSSLDMRDQSSTAAPPADVIVVDDSDDGAASPSGSDMSISSSSSDNDYEIYDFQRGFFEQVNGGVGLRIEGQLVQLMVLLEPLARGQSKTVYHVSSSSISFIFQSSLKHSLYQLIDLKNDKSQEVAASFRLVGAGS